MGILKIELNEKEMSLLHKVAAENEANPETLIKAQISRMLELYSGREVNPEAQKHLKLSIAENLNLLKRLAI